MACVGRYITKSLKTRSSACTCCRPNSYCSGRARRSSLPPPTWSYSYFEIKKQFKIYLFTNVESLNVTISTNSEDGHYELARNLSISVCQLYYVLFIGLFPHLLNCTSTFMTILWHFYVGRITHHTNGKSAALLRPTTLRCREKVHHYLVNGKEDLGLSG